jgi:riboflavin kinase/FMN adenylyltransferase
MLMQQLYGMDCIVELPFDRAMQNTAWQDFYQMLCTQYAAAGFVCGHDFRFGRGGAGTGSILQRQCAQDGLVCAVIPEQTFEGITVSSSYIRKLLKEGHLRQANAFLGHPHVLTGMVVPGQQLGRKLGTPTANLLLPDLLLCPKFGVYACMAHVDGQCFPAVTNIGCRPTVGGDSVTVEAWLLGYSGNLYNKPLTLEFHDFLREEKKFDSLGALQEEIQNNAAQTLEFFQKT